MRLFRDEILVKLLLIGPQELASSAVQRIDLIVRTRVVEYAIDRQREALQSAVGTRSNMGPRLLQPMYVRGIDLLQCTVVPRSEGAVVHHPVPRLAFGVQ